MTLTYKNLIIFVIVSGHFVMGQNYHQHGNNQRTGKRITNENYSRNQYSNEESLNLAVVEDNLNEITPISNTDAEESISLIETIPGEPQRDYPTYKSIPRTGFSCKGRVNWGYYADIETECQVFHVCESEFSKVSFLCPVGSAFNQKHLVCDWWYNFDCHDAISLTSLYDDYVETALASDGRSDDNNRLGRSEKATATKRVGNGYRNDHDDDDDDDAADENGLYDLNSASSGGNT